MRRALILAGLAAALAGCGGSSAPKTDTQAIADTLKSAVKAGAKGDGDKACGYLTPDAQRAVVLAAGPPGGIQTMDCAQVVKRAQLFLSPLDRKRLSSLAPTDIRINGASASATLRSSAGAPEPTVVPVTLVKEGVLDWKVSGFQTPQNVPGY